VRIINWKIVASGWLIYLNCTMMHGLTDLKFVIRPSSMIIPKLIKKRILVHSKFAGRDMHGILLYKTHTGQPTYMSNAPN